MLAKKYKLPIQKFVGKRGEIRKTPYFLLKIFSLPSEALVKEGRHSRFGVTISVKVAKKATDRNRFKRMVYNFVRENFKTIKPGDYWISILPAAADLPKERFLKEFKKLLDSRQ